jgi:hypothetical protein
MPSGEKEARKGKRVQAGERQKGARFAGTCSAGAVLEKESQCKLLMELFWEDKKKRRRSAFLLSAEPAHYKYHGAVFFVFP